MPTPNPYEFADALEPKLRELYLELVKEARGRIPMAELQQAIASKNQAEVIRIVQAATGATNPATVIAWRGVVEEVFGRTAMSTAARLGSRFGFQFNLFDPGVLGQIDALVADQVLVGADTQVAIKNVVNRGWVEGITTYNQGRMIRSMVGPVPAHSDAATNYLIGMRDAGVPEETAVRNYELYQNRLTNWRAETISHTENIRAANAGRIATWVQMVTGGFLEPDRMWLKWFTADDDRLCDLCAPMDGQEIPFGIVDAGGVRHGPKFRSTERGYPGEPDRKPKRYDTLKPDPYGVQRDKEGKFISVAKAMRPSPLIEVEYPPLHPRCRCDVRLIMRDK